MNPIGDDTIFLWCLVDGSSEPIKALVSARGHIQDLKAAVVNMEKDTLRDVGFPRISLWKLKPHRSIPLMPTATLVARIWQEAETKFTQLSDIATKLEPVAKLSQEFAQQPADDQLHIIVTLDPAPNKQPPPSDVDLVNTWRTNRKLVKLPLVEELPALVKRSLADSEKVPISDATFSRVLSDDPTDPCTENDLRTLFTVGEPSFFISRVMVSAAADPPPSGGTEKSFISFWDDNIRKILQLLLPAGRGIRNSNLHTETRKLHPDFGFLLGTVFPFRGEEKGPENAKDPRLELVDKLTWRYDPAPYMFGYYCRDAQMGLVAITPPSAPGADPTLSDIGTFDLRLKNDRIANIRHLINLSTLLPMLAELVPPGVDDYHVIERESSRIEFTNTSIIKTFTSKDGRAKVKHLEVIYKLLKDHSIPNTDSLVSAKENVVVLSSRGISTSPDNERELRECLECILEVLHAIHKIPLYHRDIRWDNIVRKTEDKSRKWFLIDWEYATGRPTRAAPSLKEENHSPAVFRDGHGPEVDIWAVGHLIQTSAIVNLFSSAFRELGERVCRDAHELTAQDVLASIVGF